MLCLFEKIKSSNRARLLAFIDDFGKDIFSTNRTVLFCTICEVKVAADRKFTVEQHASCINHINVMNKKIKARTEV